MAQYFGVHNDVDDDIMLVTELDVGFKIIMLLTFQFDVSASNILNLSPT